MKKINALGIPCPGPVIEAKKALEEENGKEGFIILVDNEIAVENLRKFAAFRQCEFAFSKLGEKEYEVHIVPGTEEKQEDAVPSECEGNCQPMNWKKRTVVVLSSNKMGEGDAVLGELLMKGFLYAQTQLDTLPETILMYNSGVFLGCEDAKTLEDLQKLEACGVEILACGTCLNHYGLTEKLAVGKVTNMYEIAEKLAGADHVIRP
ncbi:MAG: sulfurtransferase-like selenium metabolism protein YedF [Blautia sp.]|nr:sulfurtransferase-like selenium metabolism protein YedF [Blautia sp.]MDD7372167.1 sulfurtransferase-like selenium metabolism protein YedF [Bacillota bacterium]MDY3714438.1 sulfurtransferase-like selenium metabolism protein YedF [Blautia sp.]